MKYTITYKDGEKEVIRAASIAEAVERSLMEEFIIKVEVEK